MMVVMMMMLLLCIGHKNYEIRRFAFFYLRIVYNKEARDTKILVDVSQRLVDCPMLELRAFTLLGST